jgi:hypothetical protein
LLSIDPLFDYSEWRIPWWVRLLFGKFIGLTCG